MGESGGDGRVRDGVLAEDEGAVGKRGGDVVGEVCVDDREDGNMWRKGADAAKQVDGGFEAAGEESSSGLPLEAG